MTMTQVPNLCPPFIQRLFPQKTLLTHGQEDRKREENTVFNQPTCTETRATFPALQVASETKILDKLIDVPEEVDMDVARRKLAFMGKEIDTLTEAQIAYLNS